MNAQEIHKTALWLAQKAMAMEQKLEKKHHELEHMKGRARNLEETNKELTEALKIRDDFILAAKKDIHEISTAFSVACQPEINQKTFQTPDGEICLKCGHIKLNDYCTGSDQCRGNVRACGGYPNSLLCCDCGREKQETTHREFRVRRFHESPVAVRMGEVLLSEDMDGMTKCPSCGTKHASSIICPVCPQC